MTTRGDGGWFSIVQGDGVQSTHGGYGGQFSHRGDGGDGVGGGDGGSSSTTNKRLMESPSLLN